MGRCGGKTVVTLDVTVAAATVTADSFSVREVKQAFDLMAFFGVQPDGDPVTADALRQVLDAYPCDAEGNRVAGDSNRICLELYTDPNEGGAFFYDLVAGSNTWYDPYELHLSITDQAALTTADGAAITGLDVAASVDLTKAMMPQLAGVDLTGTFTGTDGITLGYGSYAPGEDGRKNALVIWLHGAGEGSSGGQMGPEVVNLGNEVTAFYSEEFQSLFGGAYVLTPQSPTMWMDHGEGEYSADGASIYTQTLKQLIKAYVDSNSDIDTDRIIIGGCSNGGYMTMNLILEDPDYYAAAFPVCEAYADDWITEDELAGIAELPIWFTYALNDSVVDPNRFSIPTVTRLKAINRDVHVSEFADVYGDKYIGHWSWLYVFNNECVDEAGENLWVWMSRQSK